MLWRREVVLGAWVLALIAMVVVFALAIAAGRSTTAHASNVVTLTQHASGVAGGRSTCWSSPQSNVEFCGQRLTGHVLKDLKQGTAAKQGHQAPSGPGG